MTSYLKKDITLLNHHVEREDHSTCLLHHSKTPACQCALELCQRAVLKLRSFPVLPLRGCYRCSYCLCSLHPYTCGPHGRVVRSGTNDEAVVV